MSNLETITNPVFTAPSAANGAVVTPSGVAFANSAWVEVIASADADLLLTAINVIAGAVSAPFWVEVGVGSVGNESVIATVIGYNQQTSVASGPLEFRLPLPIDLIPNGSRVAVRMRKSGTSTVTWSVSISYLKKPITGTLSTTTAVLQAFPTGSALVALPNAPGTAWTNSAYTQIVASMAADSVIAGITAYFSAGEIECDLATGASSSETVINTIRLQTSNSSSPGSNTFMFMNPFDGIPSGSRFAVRYRDSSTVALPGAFGFMYYENP